MNHDGNEYVLEDIGGGVFSFRHLQTGEILHGSVGPAKEARELYVGSSGLIQNKAHECVVFDIGTGCGAQLLALLDFLSSPHAACQTLRVFSFDLEKKGLRALIAAAGHFPQATTHLEFLNRAVASDEVNWTIADSKLLKWSFIGGDFRETVLLPLNNDENLKADAVFYDFFSPASHPWLWTHELFKKLFLYSHPKTRLVTYSSATCVKAALAAAGWYVGHTIASGKKAKSIIAAGSLDELEDPLPCRFLSTFENSHKPFCAAETDESKRLIGEQLRLHPQFRC
jgi:tRNA U34 5-methylaminomethyl-2-thiouridine-forming methyltransferase MnmC